LTDQRKRWTIALPSPLQPRYHFGLAKPWYGPESSVAMSRTAILSRWLDAHELLTAPRTSELTLNLVLVHGG